MTGVSEYFSNAANDEGWLDQARFHHLGLALAITRDAADIPSVRTQRENWRRCITLATTRDAANIPSSKT